MRFALRLARGTQSISSLAIAVLVAATVGALSATVALAAPAAPARVETTVPTEAQFALETQARQFERYEVGDKVVYFHERTLGDAVVEGDFVNYQLDRGSGSLLARKTHWRDDLTAEPIPAAVVTREEAEAIAAGVAGGEVESSRLYIISPESAVFPIRPVPANPCWVVRTAGGGGLALTVVDAVTGTLLGPGVPPPYTGFSFTGPWECPGSGDWRSWSQNAKAHYQAMGYDTEGAISPALEKIRGHIKSDITAMFYEIAHGGSTSFNFACVDSVWQGLAAFKIGVWNGAYTKMPFAFIASCDGMCDITDNTFSYEFRKGSFENTATIGYCGMSSVECGSCWSWSLDWQDALFNYMGQGWTIKAAFDQAGADYPTCATNACMRFAGDETFAVVPVVARDPEPPVAAVVSPNGGEWLEMGTQYDIRWTASDNARVTSVTLLLSIDGGVTYPDTIAAGEVNDSSYVWTVPDLTTHTARVRVVALDGVPNEGFDASDADFTLWGTTAGVEGRYAGVPGRVVLEVASANPAPSGLRLVYGLPTASAVRLGVYDVSGRLVARLVDARREGGYHQLDWNPAAAGTAGRAGAALGPGVYFLRLDSDAGSATAKAVITR